MRKYTKTAYSSINKIKKKLKQQGRKGNIKENGLTKFLFSDIFGTLLFSDIKGT